MPYPSTNQASQLDQHDDPSDYPFPGVPVDKGACRLLGPTALIVQALMGTLVIASLVYKRHREKPMRPWRIWMFDVSKQVLGQAFVHGLNVLISDVVAHVAQGNPCDMYFLNILLDTTLGVGYIYLVLHGVNLLTLRLNLKGFQSGEYGDPPSISFWARQAAIYVLTILTMKLLVVGLFAAWPGIFGVAEWLLNWTGGVDSIQVIFVMGIFPIIMNVMQFWLIDSIVKASASSTKVAARPTDDAAHEPLFNDHESEDEDDDTIRSRRRADIESPPSPQVKAKSPPRSSSASEHKSIVSSSSSHNVIDASITQHVYPPEQSPSLTPHTTTSLSPGSAFSSTSSISSFRSKKSNRRSPPPPIQRPPPHYLDRERYTISTTPSPSPALQASQRPQSTLSATSLSQARQRPPDAQPQEISRRTLSAEPEAPQERWDAWADSDDWAEKTGEEDSTGRRMDATKASLDMWGAKETIAKGTIVEVS